MAVLVAGGAGFIGSHMVWGLVDAGEDVIVLDNLSSGFRAAIPPGAQFIEGDVGDYELVQAVMAGSRIDAVIHFAGSIVVPESVRNPLLYYRNNTCNSRSLLACTIEAGIPNFIFSSTAAVYGTPAHNPVAESADPRPASPYGTSKLMTEHILRDCAIAHGLHYVVLRYFNVAGADPKGRAGQSTADATHLIKLAVQTAIGTKPCLEIYGSDYPTPDGTCVRDYIHVSDLITAHISALAHLRNGGDNEVLNCGYGHGSSVLEVIAAVERAANTELKTRIGPRRPGDPTALVANANRIKNVLDWRPHYDDLQTIAAHALAWERKLLSHNESTPRMA
jgi:UDP-glucose 4-epimerase